MATIVLPEVERSSRRSISRVPIQLLAYHTAVFMGTDVDQPRNLAKSVTVEYVPTSSANVEALKVCLVRRKRLTLCMVFRMSTETDG